MTFIEVLSIENVLFLHRAVFADCEYTGLIDDLRSLRRLPLIVMGLANAGKELNTVKSNEPATSGLNYNSTKKKFSIFSENFSAKKESPA